MTEGTDAPQGGAEGIEPSAVDTAPAVNSEDTTEQQTGAEDASPTDEAGDQPKRKPWWEKRFDELTARNYEKERKIAFLEGQLSQRADQPAQSQQAQPVGRPKLEEFDYNTEAHDAAVAEYYEKRAEATVDRRLTERERQQALDQQLAKAQENLNKGRAKYPDFDAYVSAVVVNDVTRSLVLEDPRAAEVLYEAVKTNGPEAFNQLSPYQQGLELAKVTARLNGQTASPKPIPPNPPQTVTGASAGLTRDPASMSMAEYAAARKAGQI